MNALSPTSHAPPRSQGREVFAWAMYDWANSAYSTLLITVVLHYVQTIVLPGKLGAAAYAWAIGASMLLAAALSPIVGAAADARANKRQWLAATAWCGSAAAVAMALMPPDQPWFVMAAMVLMGLCFELSLVPYNGFLPEITDEQTINRISAWGFALGYIGGAIPLALAWAIVHCGRASFGLSDAAMHRLGILLLGLWWGVFSLPSIWILRDRGRRTTDRLATWQVARDAIDEVGRTLGRVRRYPILAMFLAAFLFYNDGIQTVITQANVLAVRELRFSVDELFLLVLMIQLVALPGSLLVGRLSDRLGQKPVLLACLAVWALLLIAAMFVQTKAAMWAMGAALATVLGGTQAVSRAMMGTMTPRRRAAEFFGFFNLSGKAAGVLGPVQFGAVIYCTGSARLAAVSLLVFFLVGAAMLSVVRVAEGRRQAERGDAEEECLEIR